MFGGEKNPQIWQPIRKLFVRHSRDYVTIRCRNAMLARMGRKAALSARMCLTIHLVRKKNYFSYSEIDTQY